MRWFLFLAVLTACDSPSLEFQCAPVTRTNVDGMTFSVRVIGERAEAIRTSQAFLPREGKILQNAEAAITKVSGCRVTKLDGDQAIQRATLDCKGIAGEPEPFGRQTLIVTIH